MNPFRKVTEGHQPFNLAGKAPSGIVKDVESMQDTIASIMKLPDQTIHIPVSLLLLTLCADSAPRKKHTHTRH